MPDYTQRIGLAEATAAQVEVFNRLNQALKRADAVIDLYLLDMDVDTPPEDPASADAYSIGDMPIGAWEGHSGEIAFFSEGDWHFQVPFDGLLAFGAVTETLYVFRADAWLVISSTDFATKSGTETLSNKSVSGQLDIFTNGGQVSLTSGDAPLSSVKALFNIVNDDSNTCGLRVTSLWTGTTAAPYQNNDNSLWEVFNTIESDSRNRSWAGSFANAYNSIPAGTTDSGERTGLIGWAVSAASPGFVHAGTLNQQLGVYGVAGFQGQGSAATAIITNATGVRGYIYNDVAGATIASAKAGEFITTASTGVVQNNVAVFASAANGTVSNYSFYGNRGKLFNAEQILVGNLTTQSLSYVSARNAGNCYEFGHPDPSGYTSNIGATFSSGFPFFAFCAEVDPAGNTFRTRGKAGVVLSNDLAGSMIFSRVPDTNAAGQALVEMARFDPEGALRLQKPPTFPTRTPASATATGKPGEIAWDADYIYVCTGVNQWRRSALSTW